MKILEFKSRKQIFDKWLEDVKTANFKDQHIESALFIWELPPTKEGYQSVHCKFNCDLDQLKYFHRKLSEHIQELEFNKFLRENINDYIEYIE